MSERPLSPSPAAPGAPGAAAGAVPAFGSVPSAGAGAAGAGTAGAAPTVGDVAELVRSKNAGPFWLTLDVFCDDDESYERIAADGVLTAERVAAAYRVDPAHVRIFRMPVIRVVKVSFPRRVPSGSVGDRDIHAGQQHVPLRDLPLDPTAAVASSTASASAAPAATVVPAVAS